MRIGEDLATLVNRRNAIATFLLSLYESRASGGKCLGADRMHSFHLLVGVAFSLWRAAFLLRPDRQLRSVSTAADHFLHTLCRDNSINYAQDRDNCHWTVGYYLNNAYLRLVIVPERLRITTALLSKQELECLRRLKLGGGDLPRAGFKRGTDLWDEAFAVASAFLRVWRQKPNRPERARRANLASRPSIHKVKRVHKTVERT